MDKILPVTKLVAKVRAKLALKLVYHRSLSCCYLVVYTRRSIEETGNLTTPFLLTTIFSTQIEHAQKQICLLLHKTNAIIELIPVQYSKSTANNNNKMKSIVHNTTSKVVSEKFHRHH